MLHSVGCAQVFAGLFLRKREKRKIARKRRNGFAKDRLLEGWQWEPEGGDRKRDSKD